jgi:predicted DNA-binding transcriptional regulator YafY
MEQASAGLSIIPKRFFQIKKERFGILSNFGFSRNLERFRKGCADIDKWIRFLQIIYAIQANPGVPASKLAKKCNVSVRTIYRDLDSISLVAPLTSDGHGAGFRFIGHFAMYPLNFTEKESLAVSLLPSVVDRNKLPPDFETAYDKIMAAHFGEKKRGASIIENIADIIRMGKPAYRKESANYLYPIIQAILESKTLDTVYHSQHRNVTKERQIDPYYLVPREQRFYLIAYCHLQRAVRTFRISRFLKVELTDRVFTKRKFDIGQYLKNTWSIERGDKNITFKVRFHPDVARYIKEEELFVHPRMKDLKDGGLLFQVTVNNEREFMKWVMQYGPDAEILEPQSIRERMKEHLRRWAGMYGG